MSDTAGAQDVNRRTAIAMTLVRFAGRLSAVLVISVLLGIAVLLSALFERWTFAIVWAFAFAAGSTWQWAKEEDRRRNAESVLRGSGAEEAARND